MPNPIETSVDLAEARLEWGHPLLTPDGEQIRLPQSAFAKLRRLGLLEKNRLHGLQQISERVFMLMHSDYDGLMDGLRQLLGHDLSGAAWVLCGCRDCHRREEERDKVALPKNVLNRGWGRSLDRAGARR